MLKEKWNISKRKTGTGFWNIKNEMLPVDHSNPLEKVIMKIKIKIEERENQARKRAKPITFLAMS